MVSLSLIEHIHINDMYTDILFISFVKELFMNNEQFVRWIAGTWAVIIVLGVTMAVWVSLVKFNII